MRLTRFTMIQFLLATIVMAIMIGVNFRTRSRIETAASRPTGYPGFSFGKSIEFNERGWPWTVARTSSGPFIEANKVEFGQRTVWNRMAMVGNLSVACVIYALLARAATTFQRVKTVPVNDSDA
jgi:hypothetical protein